MTDTFLFPEKTFRSETVYRTLGDDARQGRIGCGFLLQEKPTGRGFLDTPPPWYGILYLLRGYGWYVDRAGRKIRLSPGCVIQRFPSSKHATYPDEGSGWAECFVVVGPDMGAALVASGMLDESRPVFDIGYQASLVQKFEAHLLRLQRADDTELSLLLGESVRLIGEMHVLEKQERGKPHRELLRDVCLALADRSVGRTGLEEIARKHHISYERLRKVFREEMGISPAQYRIRGVIDRACALLRETNLTVQQIALRLNYPDAYTFSRQFKKQLGVSPMRFREMP